jgi:hypothetical protein
MEQPKLTAETTERIINFLRDNPGVSMTLSDLANLLKFPIEELAAHLETFAERGMVIKETAVDGVDSYSYPAGL